MKYIPYPRIKKIKMDKNIYQKNYLLKLIYLIIQLNKLTLLNFIF